MRCLLLKQRADKASYPFQLKSYLPVAVKPLEALTSRFKPPLGHTDSNKNQPNLCASFTQFIAIPQKTAA